MIHVGYAMNDQDGRYSKFVGISVVSMFENVSKPVTVHILHDNSLSNDNRDKFTHIAMKYRQGIEFYNVDELVIKGMDQIKRIKEAASHSYFHLSAMYRLLLPELIEPSVGKIIYLDAGDTLVNLDINELWNQDVSNFPIAAVAESAFTIKMMDFVPICKFGTVRRENYFNSGVVILNLDYLRKNMREIWGSVTTDGLERPSALEFLTEYPNQFVYPDQDMLNYCFSENYFRLAAEFNCIVKYERFLNPNMSIGKKIYHFAGVKPELDTHDPFNRLYLNYFAKTPWFNANIFDGIFESVNREFDKHKRLMLNLANLLAERRRAFFLEPYYINSIREMFNISSNEFVCNASDPNSIEQLVELMRANRDKVLLFVLADNYLSIRRNMKKLNFVEGRDYINIANFLTSDRGSPFNSQSVVSAM